MGMIIGCLYYFMLFSVGVVSFVLLVKLIVDIISW